MPEKTVGQITVIQKNQAWELFYGGIDKDKIRQIVGLTATQLDQLIHYGVPKKKWESFIKRMQRLDAEQFASARAHAREVGAASLEAVRANFDVVKRANRIAISCLDSIDKASKKSKRPPAYAVESLSAVKGMLDPHKPAAALRQLFGGDLNPQRLDRIVQGDRQSAYDEEVERTGEGLNPDSEEMVRWMQENWTAEELQRFAMTGERPARFAPPIDVEALPEAPEDDSDEEIEAER